VTAVRWRDARERERRYPSFPSPTVSRFIIVYLFIYNMLRKTIFLLSLTTSFYLSLSSHSLSVCFSLYSPCRSVCCALLAAITSLSLSLSLPSPSLPHMPFCRRPPPVQTPPPPPRRLLRSQAASTAARTLPLLLLQVRTEELSSPVLERLILLPVVVHI
jgi:hypothetical protein